MHVKQFFHLVMLLGLGVALSPSLAAGMHGDESGKGAGHGVVGEPGRAGQATRSVTIDMTDDMRFNPAQISVRQGETIRFIVRNSGKLRHEMVLGTPKELKEHYDMMMKMPGMNHAQPGQVVVDPGKQGQLIWRFSKAGKVDFACLQPGHYDAGMKGLVTVAGRKSAAGQPAKTGKH